PSLTQPRPSRSNHVSPNHVSSPAAPLSWTPSVHPAQSSRARPPSATSPTTIRTLTASPPRSPPAPAPPRSPPAADTRAYNGPAAVRWSASGGRAAHRSGTPAGDHHTPAFAPGALASEPERRRRRPSGDGGTDSAARSSASP